MTIRRVISTTGAPPAAPVPDLPTRPDTSIPADLATCAGCLHELFDPADRRHRYPFITCASCGPRATIIEALPYDRSRTTMRHFEMCSTCAAEYHDPASRRFHAESIACSHCGPRLRYGGAKADSALRAAVDVIAGGGVVAVKGLGGFQLVCDAIDEEAVYKIRALKARQAEPLAVMVRDLIAADALADLGNADRRLLAGAGAPIVVVPCQRGVLPIGVCDGLPGIGVSLPSTPLHHLLLDELRRPLVVTSANRELALAVDGLLSHDRAIADHLDDSVLRSLGSRNIMIRRARGFAPASFPLPVAASEPLLAVGAEIRSTFTLARGRQGVVSPHLGDLKDAETLETFDRSLERLSALHGIEPVLVAHDLHPGYLSTKVAQRWRRRVAVQHHHAHVAAVAAEHRLPGPFLGLAYDGLGLGDDGTWWGGELLLADYTGYRRLGRFSRAPMPGGTAVLRRPARMALGYLLGGEATIPTPIPEDLAADCAFIHHILAAGVNCPVTSSAGCLFDAAAALLELCDVVTFEGEAALRLEQCATATAEPLAWRLERRGGQWVYDGVATLRDLLEARADGEPVGRIAAAFHTTIAAVTLLMCEHAAAETGVSTVCLAGDVFQNRRLATDVLTRLEAAGFDPYIGERIPVNDGGISFGQAVIAAARSSRA